MAVAALAAWCGLRLLLAAPVYDVGARLETRLHLESDTRRSIELEANPRLGVGSGGDGSGVGVAYFPRLAYQASGGDRLQVLHRASLGGVSITDAGWRVSASASGSYGTTDLLTLPPPSGAGPVVPVNLPPQLPSVPAPVQPVPRVTRLRYGSGDVTAGLEGKLAPGQRLRVSLSGFVDGGLDAASQSSLAQQRGTRVAAELETSMARKDTLATGLTATYARFTPGIEDAILALSETWRHGDVDRRQTWIGGGAAGHLSRGTNGSTAYGVMPIAEVGVRGRAGPRDSGYVVTVSVAPLVDRLTGDIYERANAITFYTWSLVRDWSLVAGLNGGPVLGGERSGQWIAVGDLHVDWKVARGWDALAGARALAEDSASGRVGRDGSIYVAINFQERGRL